MYFKICKPKSWGKRAGGSRCLFNQRLLEGKPPYRMQEAQSGGLGAPQKPFPLGKALKCKALCGLA